MSGETERNISGWTTDTLRSHLMDIMNERDLRYQQRFESQESNLGTAIVAQEKAVAAALGAAERAVAKAETATEKRFDGVNEFRGQLSDQARTFMPRSEAELQFKQLTELVDKTIDTTSRAEARSGGLKDGWGYLVGALSFVGLIVTIIVAVITHH